MVGATDLTSFVRRSISIFEAFRRSLTPLDLLILAQLTYVVSGIAYLDFSLHPLDAATAVGVATVSEWLFSRRWGYLPRSAIAAGLGIAIFFRATNPLFFALCAFAAIASKYVVRFEGNHIFNPSNFAIVTLVFIFPFATTIEFTQWGSNPYLYGAISLASLFIAYRAGVFVITGSFIASYLLLLLFLAGNNPALFGVHHYGLIGPSFILFASFMITDPKTAPRGLLAGSMHGLAIALLFFTLEAGGLRYSLFAATFILTVLNVGARVIARGAALHLGRHTLPPNALSLGFVAGFTVAAVLSVAPAVTLARAAPLSWSFILFGVESGQLKACHTERVFVKDREAGVVQRAVTSGAAWGDYNNDGFDDLLVSNLSTSSILYRNRGDGTFADVTRAAGLPAFSSRSAFFVDYDNDRDSDLFVVFPTALPTSLADTRPLTEEPLLRVYQNADGHFAEVTGEVGLEAPRALLSSGTMSFGDYDNDGDLDFVVVTSGRLIRLLPERYRAVQKSTSDPAFVPHTVRVCGADELRPILPRLAEASLIPEHSQFAEALLAEEKVCADLNLAQSLANTPVSLLTGEVVDATLYVPGEVRLYENKGRLFEEQERVRSLMESLIDEGQHVGGPEDTHPYNYSSGINWQPVSFDYDGDGRVDIFFAIEFGTNVLLRNTGDFEFEDVTAAAGVNYKSSGMGVDIGDFNNDGLPDIVVTNVLRDYLYRNNGDGTFTNLLYDLPLAQNGIGWGVAFLDYNLDGWEDLYIANGDTLETLDNLSPWLTRNLFRRDNLYRNLNGDITNRTERLCPDTQSGKALAVSDYDKDGDPDVFLGNYALSFFGGATGAEENVLYENTHQGHAYIGIIPEGTRSNAMGVGAQITVTSGNHAQTRWVTAGSSLNSQHGRTALFGLGEWDKPVDIVILWPSGAESRLRDVEPGQVVRVRE